MKRLFAMFLMAVVLVLVAACSQKEQPKYDNDEVPLPISVDLSVTEEVDVNGTVEMAAVVMQGDEKVEDADEVIFEVWEEGKKDESIMIESTNKKEGLYTAETSFNHDGHFHIQSHVTARAMHIMPKKEVTVGDGGHYEEQAEEGHAEGHEHTEGFSMHFDQPEQLKANEATDLNVHLEMDGKPLEQARVRYEIWNDADTNQRDWVETKETTAGEYAAPHTFADAGTFQIQIHVEDEHDLHEHETYMIEVTE